jgi:selenocysteine lyase/cysteine desulfurase
MEASRVRVDRVRASSEDEFIEQLGARCLHHKLAFVVLSQVSYKDGRVLPISRVAELLAPSRVPLIIDGNQAIGQIAVDLLPHSYAAYIFSGHKWLCAPMGTGAISVNPDFFHRHKPVLEIFEDLQNGTLSYVALAGIEAGCEQATGSLPERIARQARLRHRIFAALRDLPYVVAPQWSGPMAPGIASLLLPEEVSSLELATRLLARHGVAVRPFIPPERPNAIRISWAPATTEAEVELLIGALKAELS